MRTLTRISLPCKLFLSKLKSVSEFDVQNEAPLYDVQNEVVSNKQRERTNWACLYQFLSSNLGEDQRSGNAIYRLLLAELDSNCKKLYLAYYAVICYM